MQFQNLLMFKNYFVAAGFVLLSVAGFSQATPNDTVPVIPEENLDFDTTFNYDELLNELDIFLDSLLMPRNYFLASISAGSGYFNYYKKNNKKLETVKKAVYTPTLGYYHKTGPGLTLSGNMTNDGQQLNLYQYSVSPSFDFIQNHDWVGGISYIRYFTKDSLPFYSSPLQNEFNAYVVWRKPWLQPGITTSYGWGSRLAYEKREKYIRLLRSRRLGYIFTTNTQEDISDFSISTSVRHSFYWMHILGEKDYIKFTPQMAFSAGTQKFGFNRTTSTYPVNVRTDTYLLYNSGDVSVDEKLKFQPLSLSVYLRPEYNIGKFFVQPQFILDYYIPAENLAALFSINAGIIL